MGSERNQYLECFTSLARAIKNASVKKEESKMCGNSEPNPLDIMRELYILNAQDLELVLDYMIYGKVDLIKHLELMDKVLVNMRELNDLCDAYGSPRLFASVHEGCDHTDVEKELHAFTSAPMEG